MSVLSQELKVSFQLTAHEGRLEVRAAAPRGEGRVETALPAPSLIRQMEGHYPARIPDTVIESVGKLLYQTLTTGDPGKLALDVLDEGRSANKPVQFEIRFDADQVALAQYPWEMLVNHYGQMLVRDGLIDLTRYITYPQPPPVFDISLRDLALLRVVAQPPQLPPITAAELSLKHLETLPHASFDQLMRKLLIERLELWGLQFDGHGTLVAKCPACGIHNGLPATECRQCKASLKGAKRVGALAFERNGNADWVTTEEFGAILYNAKIRIVMLLACDSARVGNQLLFSGLSPSLVLSGVPAVVGMQYPILDDFANRFAQSFYEVLIRTNDVLEALRTARRMSIRGAWYSPVLYLRHQRSARIVEPSRAIFQTRKFDTALPAEARPGVAFLARFWIRRPETRPLSERDLRDELDVPDHVPVRTREAEADVKFEPVEGRSLRRGEVEVRLQAADCEVTPEHIKLFVDEHLDAPPAIFTLRARQVGRIPAIFSAYQDGGQICSVTHHIRVVPDDRQPDTTLQTETNTVPVNGSRVTGVSKSRPGGTAASRQPSSPGEMPARRPGSAAGSRPGSASRSGSAARPGSVPRPGSAPSPGSVPSPGSTPSKKAPSAPSAAGIPRPGKQSAFPSRPASRPAGAPSRPAAASSTARASRSRAKAKKPEQQPILSTDIILDAVGVFLTILALVSILSFLSRQPGTITRAWMRALYQGFGWGAWGIVLLIGSAGVWLIWRRFGNYGLVIDPVRAAGGMIVFVGLLTVFHSVLLFTQPVGPVYIDPVLPDPWAQAEVCPSSPQELLNQGWQVQTASLGSYDIARCGHGGGYIGAFIQVLVSGLVGNIGAFVIALFGLGAGSLTMLRITPKDLLGAVAGMTRKNQQ